MDTAFTPEQKTAFVAAAAALAQVARDYGDGDRRHMVVVGGAAVTLFAGFGFFSGDFDFVASDDAAVDRHMSAHGFIRENRPGFARFGWYHPAHPIFGFQQVTGPLFEGRADMSRLVGVDVGEGCTLVVPSLEDLVSDRLGQHAVASPTDLSRLLQSRLLVALAPSLDWDYLERRVREEGGDIGLVSGIRSDVRSLR